MNLPVKKTAESVVAEFQLGERMLRPGDLPFIVAEAGVNHENDMATAERMIREAAKAGADAIKFQTYKAEKLAASDSPTYWAESRTQREVFKQYDRFDEKEFVHLASVCKDSNILFLSTPFDNESADFLDPLLPAYKIASADISNVPLLRHIAKKGKPIIMSTGASTVDEIAWAVEFLQQNGAGQLALLHCILHYPAEYIEVNLRSIAHLQRTFSNCIIGYSDHTNADPGMSLLTAAAIMGALVIEKHFTLDKTLPGNDHYHSMDPVDLALFVENLRVVWKALGSEQKSLAPGEMNARKYARRSLVSRTAIGKGEKISEANLTTKRPGTGIPARQYDNVIGHVAKVDINADTILNWSMLSNDRVFDPIHAEPVDA